MNALLTDLFPGFDTRFIDTGEVKLHCRIGGSGPPLLLLHGYPQCHAIWHKISPLLADHFTLIIPDLRGCGQSEAPADDADHTVYSKRRMALDMRALMEQLGHETFACVGHDRGGRVAYRMALDLAADGKADQMTQLALLDIIPTTETWKRLDTALGLKTYHWFFLAQPEPLPETLIMGRPDFYSDFTLASWTADKSLDAFDPDALALYRIQMHMPQRVSAMCADYRAGATTDRAHDDADMQAGNKITCPMAVFWGTGGLPPQGEETPIDIWSQWCDDVTGGPIEAGHFLPEEAPDHVARALLDFLRSAD